MSRGMSDPLPPRTKAEAALVVCESPGKFEILENGIGGYPGCTRIPAFAGPGAARGGSRMRPPVPETLSGSGT